MTIPNLKRLKILSEQELRVWLSKQTGHVQSVMLVTYSEPTHNKYVSRAQVAEALDAHGWISGVRYTLNGTLLGHVISTA